ncbi:hypothetical protein M378DRAFT_18266 [Amanita muscaria Koide BX008]|uniref:Uncharacterized protein n=1 Tax=Amanita muscaria (strain Koide BX008) TaxID=946122 RepID=A0A0C2WET7_AMAMK|nr:hypothetical protein M378DRAFT_18266 [Amanita muscaria Koide BX008]
MLFTAIRSRISRLAASRVEPFSSPIFHLIASNSTSLSSSSAFFMPVNLIDDATHA